MTKETREGQHISEASLDELLSGEDPAAVFLDGMPIDDPKEAVAERTLAGEMTADLEAETE